MARRTKDVTAHVAHAKAKGLTVTPTLADCVVRAARGHMLSHGGVAFSGMLWVWNCPVASFSNAGEGGCHKWVVNHPAMFAAFEQMAKDLHPELSFEQADHVAGALWDKAFLAADAMGRK